MAKKISKKFSDIGSNIKKIRQAKSLSQADFAAIFNLGRPAVGAYEEGRSEPKIETIIQIAKYFGISIDALLTKQLSVAEIYSFDRLNKKLDQVHGSKEISQSGNDIPLVSRDKFLDYVIRLKDSNFLEGLGRIYTPNELDATIAFEMKGHDMENHGLGLNSGDILYCSEIGFKKIKHHKGEVLVIVTSDEVFCKRLKEANTKQLLLSSDAHDVPDEFHDVNSIQQLWKVEGYFSGIMNPPSLLEDRIGNLEEIIRKLGN